MGYASSLSRVELARMARSMAPDGAARSGRARELRALVHRHFELDLAGFLNMARRSELEAMAKEVELAATGTVGELRARLWTSGAEREAGGRELLGTALQPVPIVLGGKLVHPAQGNGAAPPTRAWPRPIPAKASLPEPEAEPDSLEELLDNADRVLGVRLGGRGRNKGAYGSRIAAALGVEETGASEPDWRGEVEIKTVPVVRDRSGFWRVKEDPAVSMEGATPLAKLVRVLWIARVADRTDSPVLSWYYQECDERVRRLLERDLHTRPKGGAGATTRGWYVHKRFFADSGFLRSLNG